MTVKSTEALGPFVRFGLWVQGCHKNCLGCISADSRPIDGGYDVDVVTLAKEILNCADIEGLSISGGEPFLQSKELAELLRVVKSEKNLGVIIYTGMNYEDVKNEQLLNYCDILIDGEYIETLNDGLSLKGSSNQKVIMLTSRYAELADIYGVKGRKIELHFMNDKVTMVGIPDTNSQKLFKSDTQ